LQSLATVLAYHNPDIILGLQRFWDLPAQEVEDLFQEVKKYLWLAARVRDAQPEGVPPELAFVSTPACRILDEFWHCFVLFTRDYETFCRTYLGGFLHHQPETTPEKREDIAARLESSPELREQEMQKQRVTLHFIVKELGEETLVKWFETIPARYTTAFLNAHRRPFDQ
jgi:hypothetical protein